MRGRTERQATMLLGVTAEEFIPQHHPIRRIRRIVDAALARVSDALSTAYAEEGRRSVPPEHLIKATLLMAFYSIRSERQFCERLRYDLLFKWFLDLNITDPSFHHSTFSKNRKRIIDQEIARQVLGEVVVEARRRHLISDDHFSVDGTLLQAWASMKSLRPRDGRPPDPGERRGRNPSVDFHGQRRSNETHVSQTDAQARLARKGYKQETRLCYGGHLLVENRNGLIVDALLTQATGTAEREAALTMLDRRTQPREGITLGADKGYDARAFIEALQARGVTPHIAQNTSHRRSAVDDQVARQPGYAVSQRRRKIAEEPFGWEKTIGGGRQLRYVGAVKNQEWMTWNVVAYDLVRMAKLEVAVA